MKKILLMNGPNLNMLGVRDPAIYGSDTLEAIEEMVRAYGAEHGCEVDCFQSNHEGDIIDEIQSAAGRADGIIINPGGYAYYSVAILEALQLCGVPAVEVMLHDPSGRESFRNTDVVSFGCQGRFAGEGISGYLHACSYLVQLLRLDGSAQSHMVQ